MFANILISGETVGWVHVYYNNVNLVSYYANVCERTLAGDILIITWSKQLLDKTFMLIDDNGAEVKYRCEDSAFQRDSKFYTIVAHSKVKESWTDSVYVMGDYKEAPIAYTASGPHTCERVRDGLYMYASDGTRGCTQFADQNDIKRDPITGCDGASVVYFGRNFVIL